MPNEFENVTVVVPANVYFDGAVTSRTVRFADGSEKTLGFMQPGEYEFGTQKPEVVEITAGKVSVKLADADGWTEYAAGDAFDVPGDSRFQITAIEMTDYVCSYLDG